MDKIALFNELKKLLDEKARAANITDLERYYTPEAVEKQQSPFFRLASSLQNGTSGGMDRSIKFNGENQEIICKVLCDCDYSQVCNKFGTPEELYDAFGANIPDSGAESRLIRANKGKKTQEEREAILKRKTNWEKYSVGLFEGAHFLKNDQTEGVIKRLLSYNDSDKLDMKEIKALIKKIKIKGLGIALCCDWLKECGCTWLVKPDVHIKLVYQAMKEKETGKALSKIDDYDVIEYYYNWAKELQRAGERVTAYQLDKMIWLICTGEFYLHKNEHIGRNTIIQKICE